MILIALGANLETARFGPPRRGLEAALRHLEAAGVAMIQRSGWYRSAPFPAADQPFYVNGVAEVESTLSPTALLALMLEIETAFGRRRGKANAARVMDLDLIDFRGRILDRAGDDSGPALRLPHPRMDQRAFVLLPLAEIAPDWRHPESGRHIDELIAALPEGQEIDLLET
ncbi:MAG: 2-amino-4-hydroxy-6-hydroxymethyldihydropteridine diphosphokinase [Alphaproteobacteria bacterium]|jgi:2-amino-4-hydroxy-6-hydroxymethyldihydropteridine diphosphokinase|nr:2-amino-4-hydroxy-6-hydroxymethyldihydropteridine diphosphokinase [Alphaproteobacteria bacterium]MDP6587954.1 2-amino-4-hydroxy-6-hydroxymethyldihydropteridine diphosphokinase [Alphaproteobacteria bacterium]MDP6818237.1 2-amino-4-hydroxy-6-hydroxymethyldihydropteridine diphosphokinase [Alphaproteobacteria bacterium]